MVPVTPTVSRRAEGVVAVDPFQPVAAAPHTRRRIRAVPAPAMSGGMLVALAMNRRARGLRGLDVLRRSQDRAPPQVS
jgi:hypothetical protein